MKTVAVRAAVLGFFLLAGEVHAEAVFQFAAPNFRAPRDPAVNGLRFSVIHGENQSQRGIDLGMISMSKTGRLSGLALVAGVGRVTGDMANGASFAAVNWHSGSDRGVNGAFVNMVNDTRKAFNVGFVTIAKGGTGVDLGGFNLSQSSKVQLGFINVTNRIEGFQFGFVNIAQNGFLPVFPVFNFPR